MLSLSSLQTLYLLIEVLNFSFSVLLVSLFVIDLWLWKLCKSSVPYLFSNDGLLCLLSVINLSDFGANLKLLTQLFRILFNQIIFIPNGLGLHIGFFGIHCLLILPFYSIFSFLFMDLYVVLNSFHHNLLIKVFLSHSQGFVWIMLELNPLPYTV